MMLLISPDTTAVQRIAWACGSDEPFEHLGTETIDLDEILATIEDKAIDVVVVGPELDPHMGNALASAIAEAYPTVGIVEFVVGEAIAIREALLAGASNIVIPGMSAHDIAQTIASVRERLDRRSALAGNGSPEEPATRVITVASPRGGVGRTLVATAIASRLEHKCPGEVVLVDLDLQCGDVAPLLGLAPNLSISSAAGRANELNSADLKALLVTNEDGLHVLAAPDTLSASVGVTGDVVASVITGLNEAFRYVVLDTGSEINEVLLSAIDQTTDLVFVCAPDVPSVRALGRASDALEELRVSTPNRHLVINKATERYGMPVRDIEVVSGMAPVGQIPAAKEIAMALNMGSSFDELVHPKGVVAKGLRDLVNELLPEGSRRAKRRRLLGLGK